MPFFPIQTIKDCRKGFTLLEILVALALFSLLLTIVYGSFRTIMASSDSLGRGTVQLEMLQGCLDRITSDIEAIYVSQPPAYEKPELEDPPDPYRVTGDTSHAGGDTFSRLRFTSLAHFSFDGVQGEGVAEITYYVHELADGNKLLRRSDHLYPYEEFEEKNTDPIICKDILTFDVTYYDEEGEDTNEWDSESSEYQYATPRSIAIVLIVGAKEKPVELTSRIHIPVFREGRE